MNSIENNIKGGSKESDIRLTQCSVTISLTSFIILGNKYVASGYI